MYICIKLYLWGFFILWTEMMLSGIKLPKESSYICVQLEIGVLYQRSVLIMEGNYSYDILNVGGLQAEMHFKIFFERLE